MKKVIFILSLLAVNSYEAQFKINVEVPSSFTPKEVYLYTLNGSKDVLNSKEIKKGNSWQINVSKPYSGMMKLYFPETNASINFISENKDVKMKFETEKDKIVNIDYIDEANYVMDQMQDIQKKKEYILPALYQIKEYYKTKSDFATALNNEVLRLSNAAPDLSKFPFVAYYGSNYNKFLEKNANKSAVTHDQIIDFLTKSNELLESSSLLRPILVAYLNAGSSASLSADVDKMLKAVNVETPRGQTVLSELIEIFDTYAMQDLKDKYLTEAKNLKCTINERLKNTIETNINTEIGATFPNYVFNRASNTKAKSIYDVKADKKIIVFWASTCSHCEAELPKIIEKYSAIKGLKGEVIAFSLDSDALAYENKAKMLPWINDSELKGWNSSFSDTYNVHATPSYYILDGHNKIIAKPDHAADVISYLKLN
ncbi:MULTISPECIES: TlpA disulfide reductase family protein [Chryseobacterium]|uniref:Thiol-disulfide oxidoreductase ResA n=1 Tax=Chryseobacterium salivictor TaxID=2547600 RepID=A0A4P6ZF34_9FLAO|nr:MULTISPECIES: TlpA disulfide reductase family protein [Chryseobacterium]MDQ0477884.1 thiol-disulfide isomerase/thioredoxin [Chryseobacterium sp. MDT2-18]QBO58201.1 Thiol-disulfide oxidoreductase ResA [Chryseobacterium salivictor]